LIEAYDSGSNEPVIEAKILAQQDAGSKAYECGTIRDNGASYGQGPDLLVLRLVREFTDGSLDFREILDCRLAGASFLFEVNVPKASVKVQLAIMQAVVLCTSRALEHWHVMFATVHPTLGMVCAKQLSYTLN
jgi:hypothetical protein